MLSPAIEAASRSIGATSGPAIANRGATSARSLAVSAALQNGLSGVSAAPARQIPTAMAGHDTALFIATATGSPRSTPCRLSHAATAAESSASCTRVSRSPLAASTIAARSASAAASRSTASTGPIGSTGAGSGLRKMVGVISASSAIRDAVT